MLDDGSNHCQRFQFTRAGGSREKIMLLMRLDTATEVQYYRQGGILQYVLRQRFLHQGG